VIQAAVANKKYTTQLGAVKQGLITQEVRDAATYDKHVTPEFIAKGILDGNIVLPKNINHNFKAIAIGKGLTTKVNANIGSSARHSNIDEELLKLKISIKAGTHSIMDLSTGADLAETRRILLKNSSVMVGAVPLYATAAKVTANKRPLSSITVDELFYDLEEQCRHGLDYITVHCGITMNSVQRMLKSKRELGVVSRGGSLICAWIVKNEKENPLYEYYDRLLDIALKYDVTLSLGDGFRPGSVVDSTDRGQVQELITLGELAQYARSRDVQVMIEGPGHVPINEIQTNVQLQKKLCNGAPFYVLGPLTTDIAPGFDHITAAIGGAIAAAAGADFLCYVTPAEHLLLPTIDDVYQGVIAARLAAHSGDIGKGVPTAIEKDRIMSGYRRDLNWEGMYSMALDGEYAKKRRQSSESSSEDICTMCGDLCAIKTFNECITSKK